MGQRPTAMILNDPYAGHRKWWNAEWVDRPELANVWTEWDYILLRVYQYMEDFTTANGHPVWVEEDPDVSWEFEKVSSFYEKEMHDYRENHEVNTWEHLRAKPIWEDDVETPSMEKWIRRMDEDDPDAAPRDREGNKRQGRPPTPEELAELTARRAEALARTLPQSS